MTAIVRSFIGAAALAAFTGDLSNSGDPAKGLGLVGFSAGTPYAPGSLGDLFKKAMAASRDLRSFGTLANDGATNDLAVWQAAAASGERIIRAEGLNCKVQGKVIIPAGQIWMLSGTTIRFTGTATRVFEAVNVDDWALYGPFTMAGDLTVDPGTGVTSEAIYVENCARWRIVNPTIKEVQGYGIHMVPGSSLRPRGDGGAVVAPMLKSCVWGWKDEPGSGAEYCTVTDVHATGCAQAGVETSAGNIVWNGGHCVDNVRDGFRIRGGANHAHGIVTSLNCNHNGQFNLHAKDVTNGQSFVNCHFYANNSAGSGVVWLENCKGVTLDGGILDCWIYNDIGAAGGFNYLRKMHCPGGYGGVEVRNVTAGKEYLIVQGMTGPGSVGATSGITINDGGLVYAHSERDPGNMQAFSGTAVLLFPNEKFDRRAAHNTGTGTVSIPAGMAGLYRVRASVIYTGTAMNAAGCFVDMQVNGVSKRLSLGSIYSTTKVQISIDEELYLNDGDVVRMMGTVAGTGTAFGDATWGSYFTVERIA